MTTPFNSSGGQAFEDDPFGGIKEDSKAPGLTPKQVASVHARSDVDNNVGSLHHTLGVKHTQAAAGDHIHNGIGSLKLGTRQGNSVTGSRSSGAAMASLLLMLGNIIEFTDNTTP